MEATEDPNEEVIKEDVKLVFQENQVVWLYLHGQISWRESMEAGDEKNPTLNPNKTYMPEEETTTISLSVHRRRITQITPPDTLISKSE